MKQDNCLFCKIISGEIPSATVFENGEFKVILDKFPGTKGHMLIIPKEHVENIFEMDAEMGSRLFALAVHMAKIMKMQLGLEGLNIVQNNGKLAGQTIFHFHLHLIPRYEQDQVDIHWKAMEPTDEELEQMAEQMSAALK